MFSNINFIQKRKIRNFKGMQNVRIKFLNRKYKIEYRFYVPMKIKLFIVLLYNIEIDEINSKF